MQTTRLSNPPHHRRLSLTVVLTMLLSGILAWSSTPAHAEIVTWTKVTAPINNTQANYVSPTSTLAEEGKSVGMDVSADGRYVVFTSRDPGWVTPDTNNERDVFVKDMLTGAVSMVSVDSAGNQMQGLWSYNPVISRNGRFVAFGVVGAISPFRTQTYLRDLELGQTVLISKTTTGSENTAPDTFPRDVSNNGKVLMIESGVGAMTTPRTAGFNSFIGDGASVKQLTFSHPSGAFGWTGNGMSISADGSTVAMEVYPKNSVGNQYTTTQLGVLEYMTSQTDVLTITLGGGFVNENLLSNNGVSSAALSEDGQVVAFTVGGSGLVSQSLTGREHAYLYNRVTGQRTALTVNDSYTQRHGISFDGRYVSYMTNIGTNVVGRVFDSTTATSTDVTSFDAGTFGVSSMLGATSAGDSGQFLQSNFKNLNTGVSEGNDIYLSARVINFDTTAPEVTGIVSTGVYAPAWNNAPVTVDWTAVDDSGSASTPPPTTVGTEGASQVITSALSCDPSGNCATGSVSVSIDLTAPSISGQVVNDDGTPRLPSTSGWYGSAVRIHWTCSDAMSGIASCPADTYLSTDAQNYGVTATAFDLAGNSAEASVTGINIDSTAPTTLATTSCGVGNYCANGTVEVDLVALDNLSGVANIHVLTGAGEMVYPGGSAQAVINLGNTSGSTTITYWAVDVAGNVEAVNTAVVEHDNVAPMIYHSVTPQANAAGWSNQDTTVHWWAVDEVGGSGVASVTGDTVVSSETNGISIVGTAVDNAGNTSTDAVVVALDKTAPVITATVTGPRNQAGDYTGSVMVSFVCTDSLSGVVSCPTATILATPGSGQSVVGTAVDAAGNTATTTVTGINIVPVTDRATIQSYIATLNSLGLTGNNAGKVNNAITKLTKALTASWWNSAGTSPGGNQGKKVFNELHDAIGALDSVVGVPVVDQMVDDLMTMMDTWASEALSAAQARGGNTAQISQSISQLALARSQRSQGDLTNAVDAYGKAWDFASKA